MKVLQWDDKGCSPVHKMVEYVAGPLVESPTCWIGFFLWRASIKILLGASAKGSCQFQYLVHLCAGLVLMDHGKDQDEGIGIRSLQNFQLSRPKSVRGTRNAFGNWSEEPGGRNGSVGTSICGP